MAKMSQAMRSTFKGWAAFTVVGISTLLVVKKDLEGRRKADYKKAVMSGEIMEKVDPNPQI